MKISEDAKLVTLINVFTVETANQQRLVDLLAHVTIESVRHAPGFMSATLLRSFDGAKVTMYAQWRTIEDYQAMRNEPRFERLPATGVGYSQVRAWHVRDRRVVLTRR